MAQCQKCGNVWHDFMNCPFCPAQSVKVEVFICDQCFFVQETNDECKNCAGGSFSDVEDDD